ncbi:mitochondrial GTPase 1 [Onthophagus taurus]|uniref:mitochondrial GTPase 1 n=1 Tax=Onthophagus taurus TaxID=166361 RepID=UPI0039BEBE0A
MNITSHNLTFYCQSLNIRKMVQKLVSETFRSTFRVIDQEVLRWFPGHMGRGLKQMQQKLKSVDCVLEVHDARIPISGRNNDFKTIIFGVKPHILVLNKVDLIDSKHIINIKNYFKDKNQQIVLTNCKNQHCKGIQKLLPMTCDLISKSDRFNRNNLNEFCVMIIGVPNVGKSSLINALRNRYLHKSKASPVGANPGITKSVLTRIKISENPLIYTLDTPGILTPNVPNTEIGLKLALCNLTQNHLIGESIIADYLLYWLNKHENFNYLKTFNLTEKSDDILTILAQIALAKQKIIKCKDVATGSYVYKPDLNTAAKIMLEHFSNGSLGKIMLDVDLI